MLLQLSSLFCVIHVQGEKAREFLQSQLANDVSQLTPTQLQWQAYCNRQGLVQSIFGLWGEGQDYFLLISKELSASTQDLLQKYGVFSKIQSEILAPNVFLELAPAAETAEKKFQWTLTSFTKEKLQLSLSVEKRDGLLAPRAACNDEAFLRFLFIQHAFPWLTAKTANLFRPHELNLPQLGIVSFKKGCFPGQEIIARMEYRGKAKRGLYTFELPKEKNFFPAEVLMAKEQNIGQIVDAVTLENKTYLSAVCMHEASLNFFGNLIP